MLTPAPRPSPEVRDFETLLALLERQLAEQLALIAQAETEPLAILAGHVAETLTALESKVARIPPERLRPFSDRLRAIPASIQSCSEHAARLSAELRTALEQNRQATTKLQQMSRNSSKPDAGQGPASSWA